MWVILYKMINYNIECPDCGYEDCCCDDEIDEKYRSIAKNYYDLKPKKDFKIPKRGKFDDSDNSR